MRTSKGLFALLVFASGCSQKPSFSALGSACEAPQAVFSESRKLVLSEQSAPDIIHAGEELDVVLKNTCKYPGPISSQIVRDPAAIGLSGERSYNWKLDRDIERTELEALTAEDTCVVGVSTEAVLTQSALTNDPKVGSQSFLQSINAATAWPVFYGGLAIRRTVVIAVVDSGMSLTHEDLKPLLWTNPLEIPGNGIDDDRNGYVDDVHGYNFANDNGNPGNASGKDHGTHVAGLAAAKGNNKIGISGTAPAGMKLMTLNVFGSSDSTRGSATANAVRYAADNGADVINLSLGGGFSETLKAAIVYAIQKGAIVLAAAGNSGLLLGTESYLAPAVYGATINGLVTIGSVSSTTGGWSSFSNYSARYVELAAPGQSGMLSTLPGNAYGYKSGTSMATPVAAGAAALAIQMIRSHGFQATPARVELALKASGIKKTGLASRVVDGRVLNLKSLADYIVQNYKFGVPAPQPAPPVPPSGTESKVSAPCT